MIIRLLISIIFVFGGCKTTKQQKTETAKFELRKTPCFGTCPEFTFTVDQTGKATYTGLTHVEKVGEYKKTFKPEEVKKVVDAFEEANFWNFNDTYINQGVTDLPSVYTYFEHNGKSKRIEAQFNPPKELKSLNKLLDDMANSDGWEKVGEIKKE